MAHPRGLYHRTNKAGKERWYVRTSLNGRMQHFGSFPSQRAAQDFYDRMRYTRREQRVQPGRTMQVEYTVPELFDAYLPQAQHRRAYREQQRFAAWWMAYWPRQKVFDLTPQHIEAAKVALRTSGRFGTRRENTVARHVECLKHVMRAMVQPRSWVVDLWSQVTMDPPHREPPIPLTPDDEQRLLAQLSEEDLVKVRLGTTTGLRRGQIFGLRWDMIDWTHGGAHLPTFKRQKVRFLPFPTAAMELLTRRWHAAGRPPTGWVFPSATDRDQPEDAQNWYKYRFKKAVKAAGLTGKRITFHNTRHTWASRFLEGGGNIRSLQKAGDWSDIRLVEIYTHPFDDQLRTAMERGAGIGAAHPRNTKRQLQKTAESEMPQHPKTNTSY